MATMIMARTSLVVLGLFITWIECWFLHRKRPGDDTNGDQPNGKRSSGWKDVGYDLLGMMTMEITQLQLKACWLVLGVIAHLIVQNTIGYFNCKHMNT